MQTVNIHEAKTQFSKLIDAVMHGEQVIIAKASKPVAKLVGITENPPKKIGVLKGKIKISNDFDAPLPEAILKEFEGK